MFYTNLLRLLKHVHNLVFVLLLHGVAIGGREAGVGKMLLKGREQRKGEVRGGNFKKTGWEDGCPGRP